MTAIASTAAASTSVILPSVTICATVVPVFAPSATSSMMAVAVGAEAMSNTGGSFTAFTARVTVAEEELERLPSLAV